MIIYFQVGLSDKVIEINKIRALRNKFSHYCWSRITDEKIFGTGFISKQINPKKPNEGSIEISNLDIEELYKKAYKVVNELEEILQKLPELIEDKELKNKLKYK